MSAGTITMTPLRASPEPTTSPAQGGVHEELRKLKQELKAREAALEKSQEELLRRNREYEGCIAYLQVARAELSVCREELDEERMRQQVKPKALMQGPGWRTQVEDVAAEAAAHAVALWVARAVARKVAHEVVAKEQHAEVERLERKRLRAEKQKEEKSQQEDQLEAPQPEQEPELERQRQQDQQEETQQLQDEAILHAGTGSMPLQSTQESEMSFPASPDELMLAPQDHNSTAATVDTAPSKPENGIDQHSQDKKPVEEEQPPEEQDKQQLDTYLHGDQDADDPLLASFGVGQEALRLGCQQQDQGNVSPSPDTGGTPTPGPQSRSRAVAEVPEEGSVALAQTPTAQVRIQKELTMAREEIRIMKVVVQNSKREIQYYNNVLREARKDHAEDIADLQEQLDAEKKRSEEEMRHWRKHVKKEQVNDPSVAIALRKWDDEMVAMRAYQAFVAWRRRAMQVKYGRNHSCKLTTLAEMVSCFLDWKDLVVRNKAQRVAQKLHQRWFKSVDVPDNMGL